MMAHVVWQELPRIKTGLKLFWEPPTWFSHHIVASDDYRRQNGPQRRSNHRNGAVKGLVVDVVDDVQRSAVGLFAGRLDLTLRELESECPIVPQLKGVRERDPF